MLYPDVLKGSVRAAAKLIRDVDDNMPSAVAELKNIYFHTGKAYVIGVTGVPGAGKSTLVDKIIESLRSEDKTVGVIAVDPTSPFSGGAILGDRIRMQKHFNDSDVFIRSMATRGHLGGLSASTKDVIKIMDAMGKDFIIVETVGVGQDEVEIVDSAHTSLVVVIPGMGDDIQAIKAGILEIADIFVVNKGDIEGADKTIFDLKMMLEMYRTKKYEWQPPIYKVQATKGAGIPELMDGIYKHRERLIQSGAIKKVIKKKVENEFTEVLRNTVMGKYMRWLTESKELEKIVDDLINKRRDPYTVAEQLAGKIQNL